MLDGDLVDSPTTVERRDGIEVRADTARGDLEIARQVRSLIAG